jgi:hypothetical protein
MKHSAFQDVEPRFSCKNRRFGSYKCRLHHQDEVISELE